MSEVKGNDIRRLRYVIPYILVMGLLVGKGSLRSGDSLNLFLAILSLPCAIVIWRYSSR